MSATAIDVTVANLLDSTRCIQVEVLVDTDRLYGILPDWLLRRLGVEPVAKWFFQCGGYPQGRDVADVAVLYQGFRGPTRVVFGQTGDTPLLGRHALDSLGLRLDPESGDLKPYALPLYSCRRHGTTSVPDVLSG